jgi:mono/diheme cytochrome c family protein
MRCHTAGGPQVSGPGRGMMKGPDFATVGADPKHTRDWIITYVRDPRAQNPMSRMPKFGDRLADADLGSLADFILGLK